MTPDEFNALFDTLTSSAFRFEGLPVYSVDEEDPDLVAWRAGHAQAERSVRTSPWLARIARQTIVNHIDWTRVRLTPSPLSWYLRWEIGSYVESQAAGERILLTADRGAWSGPDFWLFDAGHATARGVLLHYDDHGDPAGYTPVTDRAQVAELEMAARRLVTTATPLNVWLAEHRDQLHGAGVAG